ncbi:hypothetical protein, unlikely [Trypanosoma brucei gambiense DAL972]|uniref:Uncharacterized protein n=1 Tax=Trypanosoma brucei gambiense (strain MHOM/CI/86/DAL972) TaxID=679716 RepID=C9ZVX5_TRYB9|nr:hypothetical protein, unlikely [Trypanosoma brucei gambiense DAL972]CBH13563.1 hypothetical protein, unlikely [Trypanosoma brucei gambiense DAL972]|eukprot:XP_011775840.1 hypothetical protein, unlikely [Trypanosoma brucei gambiense DAL972]
MRHLKNNKPQRQRTSSIVNCIIRSHPQLQLPSFHAFDMTKRGESKNMILWYIENMLRARTLFTGPSAHIHMHKPCHNHKFRHNYKCDRICVECVCVCVCVFGKRGRSYRSNERRNLR